MSPEYRVILLNAGGSYGPGGVRLELENVKNVGWAKYLNDVPEAFFTVNQDDPKVVGLRSHVGLLHVAILRDDVVVWRGFLGEHEATKRDVVFYAYGYVGHLYALLTTWNMSWTNTALGEIVNELWGRAQAGIPDSPLAWVSSGTIEDPVTTSGGATPIVLPSYKLYYKRILHALKELTAVATSDTTNTCYFEIDHSAAFTTHTGTFNLWKDRSTARSIVLRYGHNVADFGDRYAPLLSRNHVVAVGSGAHNLLHRKFVATAGGTHGYTAFGRRQEPLYLSWVRDEADLERVTKLRAAKALRADTDLSLRMVPDSLVPLSGYRLGDRFPVHIDRGITQIDKTMMMIGIQVYANRGAEIVRPIMLDRSGS